MIAAVRTFPEVTVCIPTYNRATCLRQLLVSIAQYGPQFRILVSDNASTDATQAVVREFSDKHRGVAYHRHTANRGAIANLLDAVRLAESDWVMLMGDDDAVNAPLDPLSEAISSTAVDAILLGRCDGDEGLSFLRQWPYLVDTGSATNGKARIFSEPEALLASGLCLGAAFSFISGISVRRQSWLESLEQLRTGPNSKQFSASLFPQSWIVLNLMNQGSSVCVVDKPYVMGRHGNDRLCQNNILEHAQLDVEEFKALGEYIGLYRPAALKAMQELIRRHLQRHVFSKPGAALYQRGKYGGECWREFSIAAAEYLNPSQRWLPSLVPIRFLESAYSIYRKYKKRNPGDPNRFAG